MTLKNATLLTALVLSGGLFAQEITPQPERNISYLDSIKSTFVKDNMASCVDSLWMKELANLDIYNDLDNDIRTINLDEKVDFELPTELLKERLKAMDAKSPFHIEYNQGLENLIKSFLKNRKKAYERLMAISEYYFPVFEEAMAKQNVPLEIKYLAVVESALNPKAVSRVGATGLWQFMYQTGKQYNLGIDSYVDERSDPLKASAAAAQYMANMYKIFGDWDLVLASYNSGPGNVAKAIRRSGGKQNFWNIRNYLPKETQGYVPAFLATMYIYEYHKEHGIVPNRAMIKHFETDTIQIKTQITFKQVSDLLDIPVAQLQLLNPSYKLNTVPVYNDKKHYLRLPLDKIAMMVSNEDKVYAYAQHEIDLREKPFAGRQTAIASSNRSFEYKTRTKIHKVRRGDNLSKIAERYNVAVSDLKKWNHIRGNSVAAGKNLKIVSTERIASVYKNNDVIADTISVVPARTRTAVAVAKTKNVKDQPLAVATSHKVVKGDNLGEIAQKYGVSVEDIKGWNNLSNNNIALGSSLKIASTQTEIITDIESAEPSVEKAPEYYVVQKGDNLSTIARKYNMTVEQLKSLNNMNDNTVQFEAKLKVSDLINGDQQVAETAKPEFKDIEYKVQKGDNLGLIAKRNNVAVSDIREWNNLADNNIQVGNKLIIGKKMIVDENKNVAQKSDKKHKIKELEDHYFVKKGDSLFSIAKKYPGITISDIKKWNGISGNSVKPGMKLKISG